MTLAVITGPSRGIGRATALALAERGIDLALLGRPSAALAETVRLAAERGVSAIPVDCELANPAELERAAERVLDGAVPDLLVNNAAVIRRAPIEQTSLQAWNEQLDVNLRAPFLLTRALLPAMRRAGRGRIINVGSISSTLGTAGAAAYCASKWGLVGLTKSLAEELSDSGLMTVAILPGSVDTRMLEGSGFAPRISADDVARTIVFHCLDAPLAHNGGVVEMFAT
jgi:3-oxoacyl-[acyl-carrier protein] reductase